jgi:2-C-methyl-D-erythritol 2,4-cyclodiphosphate synthase
VRVGLGFDLHPLVAERPLIIGGIDVEYNRGLDGHSDADVLTHAVIDALLGAAALGTIGEHFPATDPQYEGISSLELLAMAANMVEEAGYSVVNVDTVVVAEEPKLQPYLARMALQLADRLGIDRDCVGVKATSPEGLGTLGAREGIAAHAVVLIEPIR